VSHAEKADGAGRLDVVVIGEALVDVVRTADGAVAEHVGGSPLNVAVTLARLGATTALATAVGSDRHAALVADHLAASGVVLLPGADSLDRTSTAIARIGADGAADYEFDVVWSPSPEPVPPARVVHAGSIALFLDPGAVIVHEQLARASRQALVSVDPNIRPAFLPDHARAVRVFEELAGLAHVVKLSDEDVAWLYPDLGHEAVRDRLLGRGAGLIGITRGGDGCVLASATDVVEAPAPPATVVDTIGAGDSFMGALLHHLLDEGLAPRIEAGHALEADELTAAASFAMRVAAVTVARPGADPPCLAELDSSDDRRTVSAAILNPGKVIA
jgi:fructokinase